MSWKHMNEKRILEKVIRMRKEYDIKKLYNYLKDKDLQKAYNCIEPTDIIGKLFKAGEIGNIATAIMKCAGYESLEAKVHEEIKN